MTYTRDYAMFFKKGNVLQKIYRTKSHYTDKHLVILNVKFMMSSTNPTLILNTMCQNSA